MHFTAVNKYETDLYFFQIFKSNASVCLIISMFCKSCEPICDPEITPVLYHLDNYRNQNKNNFMFSVQFPNLTKRGNEHRRALEILKKIWIRLTFIKLYGIFFKREFLYKSVHLSNRNMPPQLIN